MSTFTPTSSNYFALHWRKQHAHGKSVFLSLSLMMIVNAAGRKAQPARRFAGNFLESRAPALMKIAMPEIIYGTAWKEERTDELVRQALEIGFAGVDTANQPVHYREDLVGLGIEQFLAGQSRKTRSDIFLQTKYSPGQDVSKYSAELRPYSSSATIQEEVRQSLNKSLENLRTDYLDSLVLHSPLHTQGQTMQAWRAMEQLVDEGKVKQIGISNIYDLPLLQYLYSKSAVKPSIVQNHFAPDTCFDIELRKFCAANDIRYQSFWTLTANKPALESDPVKKIATSRKLTKEQAWFLFVMADGIVPLTGATNASHMKEDLSLLSVDRLSDEDRNYIWKFVQGLTGCPV